MLTTLISVDDDIYIEPAWEFNAPRYFNFDRLIHQSPSKLNQSGADQWFFSEEAAQLEFLNYFPSTTSSSNNNNNNNQEANDALTSYAPLSFEEQPNSSQSITAFNVHSYQPTSTSEADQISTASTTHSFTCHESKPTNHLTTNNNNKKRNNIPNNNNIIGNINNNENDINVSIIAHQYKTSKLPKLTIPLTPKFATEKRKRLKDHNEVLAEKIIITINFRKLSLTKPQTPKFETDKRLRYPKKVEDKEKHITSFQSTWKPKVTSPKPFKFMTDNRIHNESNNKQEHYDYKPLMEKINEMNRELPSRWRHKPKTPSPRKPLSITKPSSFKLRTKFRSRTTNMISTEERIKLEMEQLPKFKAKPFNKKIFEGAGDVGVGRVEKRSITCPEEFSLKVDERSSKRKFDDTSLNSSNQPRPFKATKLDEAMFNNSFVKLPSVPVKPPTIPNSPPLHTKGRFRLGHVLPSPPKHIFKARPLPSSLNQPFIPKINEHVITAPEPFQLKTEERGNEYQKMFHTRIMEEKEREIEMRQFKARPILQVAPKPISSSDNSDLKKSITIPQSPSLKTKLRVRPVSGPPSPVKFEFKARPMPNYNEMNNNGSKQTFSFMKQFEPTKAEPFHLSTEQRGQAYQEKFKLKIQEYLAKRRTSFSALDDGTFTSLTKKVSNPELLSLR
ncbi:hypothetical protein ABK040_008354 [Willaertia magna]